MSNQVQVEDSQVFAIMRAAMLKFAQSAENALAGADSEISRTRIWLENEKASYWQSQLRKREDAVNKARDAVRQKKLYKDYTGKQRDAPEEEKILARCIAAMEQAREKIEAVRKWLPRLDKTAEVYRGGVAHLSRTLTDDVPRAIALLDRLALSLEQYMQIEAPATTLPETMAQAAPEESVVRPGEAADDSIPVKPIASPSGGSASDHAAGPPDLLAAGGGA